MYLPLEMYLYEFNNNTILLGVDKNKTDIGNYFKIQQYSSDEKKIQLWRIIISYYCTIMATSRLSAVHLLSIMNKSILPDEKEKYNI